MLLNQLVEINQKGLVARAVSFSLMDDVDKNRKLCEGFVFNHDTDANRAKNTTVGILDAIRRSFHSPNEPNIHLIVQDYGKGKSHFALTIANFFKLSHDRDEVRGILDQLQSATNENSPILETLTAYKQRGRHLVLCLSAEDVTDMRKHFFQVLNKELEANGITDAIAQKICREPLQFLQSLDNTKRQQAEDYLTSNFSVTFSDIEIRLGQNDFQIIPIVKQLCHHLTGINPDFSSGIQVSEIIEDLINKLCKGENAPFQGILILFDELYEYLRNWATDPTGSGGMFLQNITDACEKYKGKIALLSLTQRLPSRVTPPKNSEDYKRLVSRIEITSSTYNPKASLELVLDGLLNQKSSESSDWGNFEKKWGDELRRKSLKVFTSYAAEYYRGINWKHEDFYKHLTIGCFPLHPLTSYLLCNLSFTQGRSAIDFVQKEVEEFINNRPVEENGQLNFIYPIALVEAFEGNFANSEANSEYTAVFSDYNYSLNKVRASSDAEPEEIAILKSLLLFYTSSGRLTKSDKEKHEEVLETLTGLSSSRIAQVLDKLCRVREVIYHNPADNTYKFYGGGKGIDELRQRINEENRNNEISINSVETYCNENIAVYAKGTTNPQQFIDAKKLRPEDWFFKNEVYTISRFQSLLQKKQPFKTIEQAGIVAYVIAETGEEILQLYNEIKNLIGQHPYRDQIAVAIAQRPVERLAQLILDKQTANKFSSQEFGAALTQLRDQYSKQINNETKDLFASFTYYAHIIEDIPLGDRTSISIIVSEILENAYSRIPPIEGNDKLALKSTSGSEVIGDITKRLARGDLYATDLPTKAIFKNIIDPVFVKSWGLLRLANQQYKVSIPSNPNVKAAWDKLSEMTNLNDLSERSIELTQIYETLSAPPYGYNAYTFTILLAGWMAYHRSEIFLKGTFGIPTAKQQTVRIEPLKIWANTDIFNKPKDFVAKWILIGKSQLVRRKPSVIPIIPETLDYNLAKQKCEEVSNFITGSPTPEKFQTLNEQYLSLERACSRIEQTFEPAVRVEALIDLLSVLAWSDVEEVIDLYSALQSPLQEITENGITVNFTTEQERRYNQASQSAIEKIGQAVEIESERPTKLVTEQSCGEHKANLTQAINRLNQLENVPPRFVEALQKSLTNTEKVLITIDINKKTDACIAQIQGVYSTLSDMATQQDYLRICKQIDTLANEIPSVKETEVYRTTIESIEGKQDFLVLQLAKWEAHNDLSMSRDQASTLKDQITPQRLRYTDEISQNRLLQLLERLDNIILERKSEEGERQILQTLLASARGKLSDIQKTNSPIEYVRYYLQLAEIKLPIASSDEKIEQEISNIKSEGFTILDQRLSQIMELCKRRLEEQSKNYTQLKSLLPKLQDIAANSDELTSFRGGLTEAAQELDNQYNLLQRRINDKKIVEGIYQNSLTKANSLYLCEEAIAEIETERQKLNFPDEFREEIDSHVQAFREKANNYNQISQNLQDELSSVKDSDQLSRLRNNYNKLHQIFVNSSHFSIYQQFEKQIDALDEDIKVINKLQDLSTVDRANSLSTCDHAIYQIEHVKTTLLETERFSVKLQQLKETLLLRKQGYLSQLTEFQDGLSNSATTKEAKQVRKTVSEAASFYQNSEEKQRYESISNESELLVGLLQIFEAQKIDTPEDCAAELIKLRQWQETNPEIIPMLRSRIVTKLDELEGKRQELLSSQHKSTKTWFDRIQQKRLGVEQTNEQTEKISSSSNLLKQINKERSKHEELLEESQKQYLDEAVAFCTDIQSLDREAKIIDLFQELPIAKRESLHKRLADFLSNSEEES